MSSLSTTTTTTVDCLDTALLATVLSFLPWNEVINARVCGKAWKEAARQCPVAELWLKNNAVGDDLAVIAQQAIPNLQSFKIDKSVRGYDDVTIANGQDAGPLLLLGGGGAARGAVDLSVLGNFENLKHLVLKQTELNGKYPFLFTFSQMESLDLLWNTRLLWDLGMLSGLPRLKKLSCVQNHSLTGDIQSLGHLRDTLVVLNLFQCEDVTGDLSDLYDFPHLQEVGLDRTKVVGDLRTIGDNDLVSLKKLEVGERVYGGGSLERIDDAPAIMYARYRLKKRAPDLFEHRRWQLVDESPERYVVHCHFSREPPSWVEFVQAGDRIGWRWTNGATGGACEVNWLDAEPSPSSTDADYEKYQKELQQIKKDIDLFAGCLKPPTEAEYHSLAAARPLDDLPARFSSRSPWRLW